MIRYKTLRLIAAGALYCSATLFTSKAHAATFLISDVTNWIGPAAGPGINQAVLVIDWSDTEPAYAWGFRWDSSVSKTGGDLLAAILGADSRLTATISGAGFVSNVGWDANGDSTFERFNGDYDPGSGKYWGYYVNNLQQDGVYNDGAAPGGAHILPPLGSPYDGAGTGDWYSSNTGILGRPLVDGSWDGLRYTVFDTPGPGLAINAPIPEPATFVLIFLVAGTVWQRRRAA